MKRDRSLCTCDHYYYPHPERCEKHRPVWMCDCCKAPGVLRHNTLDPEFEIRACNECWVCIEKWHKTPAAERARVTKQLRDLAEGMGSVLDSLDSLIDKLKAVGR